MVQWTISSDERRELKRAAGELVKLGAEPVSTPPERQAIARRTRRAKRGAWKTDGTANPPCTVVEEKFRIPRGGMAVPEGLHQFKQIKGLRWLT